jgi:RNA-binding protein
MPLSQTQKRRLRTLGHELGPVVIIGNAGLSGSVRQELERALDHHQLLKVRVNAADREQRRRLIHTLCEQTQARLIQHIGHVALIYRRNPKRPDISLPPG